MISKLFLNKTLFGKFDYFSLFCHLLRTFVCDLCLDWWWVGHKCDMLAACGVSHDSKRYIHLFSLASRVSCEAEVCGDDAEITCLSVVRDQLPTQYLTT